MKINTRLRYGIRMVVTIAQKNQVINTTLLGDIMKVSPKYLRKLAGPLEKANIIRSVQGIYGGYTLHKKPQEIRLGMIAEALGETFSLSSCLKKSCPLMDECLTRPIWESLWNILQENFLQISLEDILQKKVKRI